jgi:drug/metabolite transporter (DMT)-like permease
MLWMIVFGALWAVIEALGGDLLNVYSPYQVVWTRYAVHILLMLAIWGWRQPASLWRTRRPMYQLARSLLMLGMPASWIIGVHLGIDPHTQMAIFWLSPLLILALAGIVLGERARRAQWLAAAVACSGAALMSLGAPLPKAALLVYPLAMALTFSLYVVMTRSLRSETTRANLFYTALGVLLALSPFLAPLWAWPTPHDLAVMIGIGVIGFVALYALDRMAAAAPVSIAAPLSCLQLVFTLMIARSLGHDHSNLIAMAGLLLIGATALYLWARAPRLTVVEAV